MALPFRDSQEALAFFDLPRLWTHPERGYESPVTGNRATLVLR